LLTADRQTQAPALPTRAGGPWGVLAAVLGLLGALAAIAVPFLPVHEQTAALRWPQQQSTVADVTAPLVAYAPARLKIAVPCAAMSGVAASGGGTVLSTVPAGAPDAAKKGLLVSVQGGTLAIDLRGQTLLSARVAELTGAGCALNLTSTATATTAHLAGRTVTATGDVRPQVTGVYSDVLGATPPGLSLTATIDTRFFTSPTWLKLSAMLLAAVCAVSSLFALHGMDTRSRHRAARLLQRRWWRPTVRDGVVVGTLALWHIVGTNTSDDGYLLTMVRAARSSGYLANYYRWLGVPEAPFGWYYDVIDVMSRVSTASPWLRLPALLIGMLTWLTLSRELLPRLGHSVKRSRAAGWTAAAVFLAFWLPYNNGLRPEPLIALGVVVTWCLVERSIASERLLPAALALLVSGFTLAAGPTGLICLLPVLAGLKPLLLLVRRRAAQVGWLPTLAPFAAAGLVVLAVIFADQTLAAVQEGTRVRTGRGPNWAWFQELVRYEFLFGGGADGSLARRFPVLIVMLCLVVSTAVLLRRRKLPGAPAGPSRRLLFTVAGSFGVLVVTPTKWSHHFGAFAGMGAALAALTAVAVGARVLRSRRNRALFLAALLAVLAFAVTGQDAWLYTAAWGIPWSASAPVFHGVTASSVIILLSALTAAVAFVEHLRAPRRAEEAGTPPAATGGSRRLPFSPIAVVAGVMVLAEVLVFAKAAVQRWPNYTLASANISALGGRSCALADDVRVEKQPMSGVLPTVNGTANGLDRPDSVGFGPRGLPPNVDPATAGQNLDGPSNRTTLPAGLRPGALPVSGSWVSGEQRSANLTTGWFRLPRSTEGAPLVVVTAAGLIATIDSVGKQRGGVSMLMQFGQTAGSAVQQVGETSLLDPEGGSGWRNMRVPLSAVPREADAVRMRVLDDNLDPTVWAAITPPRVPQLESMQSAVGNQPALVDWPVGLEFPCQRPFAVRNGIAEVPTVRISPPGGRLAVASDEWQDAFGGGPLGWLDLVAIQQTVPTYLSGDWGRDWGSLRRFLPYAPQAASPQLDTGTKTVWGASKRDPMLS